MVGRRADHENVFLPINLELIRKCVRENLALPEHGGCACPAQGQPSVETAMHAVLPHRIVMHVHSVNSIAVAVRQDAEQFLHRQLVGMPWAWVPYAASGKPLAAAIDRAQRNHTDAQIFILGNHGLVIAGDSCSEVESLLECAEARLAVRPRAVPAKDEHSLREVAKRSEWVLPQSEQVHALGTDPVAQAILSAGVLYPCQAIFLHGSKPWVFPEQAETENCQVDPHRPAWPFLILQGKGVLVSQEMSDAEYETLVGLAEVVLRLVRCCPVRYLTTAEASLTGGVYRAIARSSSSQIRRPG